MGWVKSSCKLKQGNISLWPREENMATDDACADETIVLGLAVVACRPIPCREATKVLGWYHSILEGAGVTVVGKLLSSSQFEKL